MLVYKFFQLQLSNYEKSRDLDLYPTETDTKIKWDKKRGRCDHLGLYQSQGICQAFFLGEKSLILAEIFFLIRYTHQLLYPFCFVIYYNQLILIYNFYLFFVSLFSSSHNSYITINLDWDSSKVISLCILIEM